MPPAFRVLVTLCLTFLVPMGNSVIAQERVLSEGTVVSSVDGTTQPFRYWIPQSADEGPRPMLVSLHSWSADYRQDRSDWFHEAARRNWIYLQPNFRGVNQSPEACGSLRARWDILDVISWAIQKGGVDESRIYLCGVSGGGHMTMLMAAYHPERFSAASAWVGISDLREWYRFHAPGGVEARYATMISLSCGGAPGTSAAVDVEYFRRSPLHFLSHAQGLPLDLNTGIHDGKTGSVPIHHTLRAYNAVVGPAGGELIPEQEMNSLWEQGRLMNPTAADKAGDSDYTRAVHLRRQHGPTRVTVFEGGHEALPGTACLWLEKQSRVTRAPATEVIP
jgi:pimeloyl-ACP methyl ester carboxylesterase